MPSLSPHGFPWSTAAEFLIDLAQQNKTPETFTKALKEQGAELADALATSIWRLVHRHRPGAGASSDALGHDLKADDDTRDHLAKTFPGLSRPDEPIWEKPAPPPSEEDNKAIADQTLAELELLSGRRDDARDAGGAEPSSGAVKRARSPSPPPRSSRYDDKRDRDRDRDRDRGRDRDYDRSYDRDRDRGYDRDRGRDGERGRPSRWEPRDAAGPSNGYPSGGRGGSGIDEEPIVNKIYNGKVSSVRDFGAFVQLDGIRGRREGAPLARCCAVDVVRKQTH